MLTLVALQHLPQIIMDREQNSNGSSQRDGNTNVDYLTFLDLSSRSRSLQDHTALSFVRLCFSELGKQSDISQNLKRLILVQTA